MSNRYCLICEGIIEDDLDGSICARCLAKNEHYHELYYDTKDLAWLLDIGEEQVRRRARAEKLPPHVNGIKRYLWKKDEIEQWRAQGKHGRRLPQTPLQEAAYARCRRQDHSWMGDARYEGDSYRHESRVDEGDNTITVGFVHTCYFCGHQETYHF